jgi:hypothetical protein
MISRSAIAYLGSAILLPIISAGLFILLYFSSPQTNPRQNEYPFSIIELEDGAAAAELLESAGLGPVISRQTATLPVSRVGRIEDSDIHRLDQRLESDDLRLSPYLESLRSVFDAPLGQGELLFVPADPDRIAPVLRESSIQYYIHQDRNLPFTAGLLLWGVTATAMFAFLRGRSWTLMVALGLLPFYLIRIPVFLAVLSVLFIVLREILVLSDEGYRDELNEAVSAGDELPVFPGSVKGMAMFLHSRVHRHAGLRGIWIVLVLAMLAGLSFLPGSHFGLLVILVPLYTSPLLLASQYRSLVRTGKQEHPLFVPRGITPSWDKPARTERAVLIAVILVSLALPFLFQINASPFPTQFVAALPLVPDPENGESAHPNDILSRQVIELLNARINTDISAQGEASGVKYPAAAYILAEYGYQQAFPYLSINHETGAGRFEDGSVILSRFVREDGVLRSFEETLLIIDEQWIVETVSNSGPYSLLRLYSDRERWYDVRPEPGVLVIPQVWNLVPEFLVLLILAFPWLGRWQFAPLERIISRFRTRSNTK